jgi:hypothetical protein
MTPSSEIETPMKTLQVHSLPNPVVAHTVAIEDQVLSRDQWMVRQITPTPNNHRCPSCHSIIYSRRHQLCGVCSRPLPSEYLFTESEAARIEGLLSAERQRHQRWLSKAFGL